VDISHVEIKYLDSDKHDLWDAYVESKPEATFFHLSGWKDVLEQGLNHATYYLYAESEQKIVGILPIAQVKSLLFGHSLVSTPFCVYGGYVAENTAIGEKLINKACELAKKLSVDYLELRNTKITKSEWLSKDLYVTFKKEIDPDPEKNMLAIPRKQRAMVRKGIKAGLLGEVDLDINRFYQAYSESVRNLGTPVFPKKYFEVLFDKFKDKCEVLTIVKNGSLVASVMSFYFRDEVMPYYGGGTALARGVKGNDFMYWDLMRRSCEKGVRVFDYGRSKLGTGSYSFKKNWGFTPEPLHYEYYLVNAKSIPDINPLNPKYKLFINIWRKLPLPVANFIGPFLAKNLG